MTRQYRTTWQPYPIPPRELVALRAELVSDYVGRVCKFSASLEECGKAVESFKRVIRRVNWGPPNIHDWPIDLFLLVLILAFIGLLGWSFW